MKKTYLLFILMILVLTILTTSIFSVKALDFALSKEAYQPREILQAEISGNFPDTIEKQNIFFYRQGQNNHVAVIYDLIKYENAYYLYMILPNSEGNFSIKIEDTKHIDSGVESEEDIVKNVNIKRTGKALSINPGFVSTINDFSITITSLNANQDITAELEATKEKQSFSLNEDESKKLTFSLSGINKTIKSNLEIGDYNIPVFITGSSGQEAFASPSSRLSFQPNKINAIVLKNSDYSFKISIQNTGEKDLENIVFSAESDKNLKISYEPELFESLKIRDEATIDIKISTTKKAKDNVNSSFVISFEDEKIYLPIFLSITENTSEVTLTGTSLTEQSSCLTMQGNICDFDEECSGETISSSDGNCCIGNCKKQGSGNNWIIGIIILVIAIAVVSFIIYKIKKQKTIKPEDILKQRAERTKTLEEPESKEVRKHIGRV